MTRFQLPPPTCSYYNSNVAESSPSYYGPIGHKRAITKTPSHSSTDINGNSSYHQPLQMLPTQDYTLFGGTTQQSRVPFQQYQQWQYPNWAVTAPTTQGHQKPLPSTPATPQCQQVPLNMHGVHLGSPNNRQSLRSPPLVRSPLGFSMLPLSQQNQPSDMSPTHGMDNIENISTAFTNLELSPTCTSPASIWSDPELASEDSEEDEEGGGASLSHPNKFPVEIEYHDNQHCSYRRQLKRSGPKMKQQTVSTYDPLTLQNRLHTEQIKYYKKDLVRICRCGRYTQMDGALTHGRNNDCDGYEIHYSQKCKWKAFDDFKTGKRVLIRLCKCYKPF